MEPRLGLEEEEAELELIGQRRLIWGENRHLPRTVSSHRAGWRGRVPHGETCPLIAIQAC